MELLHVCLNVADVDQAERFYTEQLDFEESWSFTTADGRTENRYVKSNGVELQLSETEGETEFDPGTAWDHLAVGVDDVDDTIDQIEHYGVVQEPTDQPAADARTAFIEDPDGHVIELIEPLNG
ncbi:VOC family protein [Halostella sp. JP-L12]|uniref:VOC family protein n=1 Tax=Halostella TaxID=1843185 RepID=UPI000EF82F0B|nr:MULTISPECIES: VOC family protein [Halostella]NHN48074.1 VOC family protein [Halostella sp. JP-L12]